MDRALYPAFSNLPHEKDINFRFLPDAANQPSVPGNPFNFGIASITRVAQGRYLITLLEAVRSVAGVTVDLMTNGGGVARWAQVGPVSNAGTGTPLTVEIDIVDNSSALQDPPAANANNVVFGTITVVDTSGA